MYMSVNRSGPLPEQFGPLKYFPYPSLLPTNRPPLDLTNSLNAVLGGCFAQFCLPSRSIPINTRSTIELLSILLIFLRKDLNDVVRAGANPHREEKDLICVEFLAVNPLEHLHPGQPPQVARQVHAGHPLARQLSVRLKGNLPCCRSPE